MTRRDKKGRALWKGEYQRENSMYEYKYSENGKSHSVYSWRLVQTDKAPVGKNSERCLREMERDIRRALEDGLKIAQARKLTLNSFFEKYIEKKVGLKPSITIHGRNVDAYLSSMSIPQMKKLRKSNKDRKKDVLEYTTDDAGNIDFFVENYGKCILYDTHINIFYYYTGRFWRADCEKMIERLAQVAMKTRRDYTFKKLRNINDSNILKQFKSHADRCCNQRNIKALIEGLKARVAFNPSQFNSKKFLLNCLNGTVDLRTGKLREHSPDDYINMLIPFEYDKNSNRSGFKKFLNETLPDKEVARYVKVMLGYSLTGETREQLVHFLLGNGANGKSTLLECVSYIMKGYAAVIPSKVLTSYEKNGSASPELAQLEHKRLVSCSELNCTDSLNEGKIKVISGGETLSVRRLYGSPFEYEPEFKFLIDTNYLPQISGTDHGIWRRIRVIPFTQTVSPEKIDKNLKDTLKFEAKGILAWMVEGAIEYYRKGGLPECAAVEKATKKYMDIKLKSE